MAFFLYLAIHLLCLRLCNVVGREGELILLKICCPLWNELCKAAWGIGSRENCGFSYSFSFYKHIDAAVDLCQDKVSFKGDIKLARGLSGRCQTLHTQLVAVARVEEQHTVEIVTLFKAFLGQ